MHIGLNAKRGKNVFPEVKFNFEKNNTMLVMTDECVALWRGYSLLKKHLKRHTRHTVGIIFASLKFTSKKYKIPDLLSLPD